MCASPAPRDRPALPWWLAWLIGTACLAAFLFSFDLRPALRQIAHVNFFWVLLALLGNFAVLPLLTAQWRRFLPPGNPVPWGVMWECVTLSMAAMNTVPFGGGLAVAIGLIARRAKTGWSGALSLMALEQLCDGIAKLALLLAALAVIPLPGHWRRGAWLLAAAVLGGLLVLLWLAQHPDQEAAPEGWRHEWSRRLLIMKQPGPFAIAVGLSLAMKAAGLVSIYAVQRSLGIDLPMAATTLVLAATTFATLIPIAPGNLGIYQAAAFGAYRLLGVPEIDAVALGLVLHLTFIIPAVGTGYLMTAWKALFHARSPAQSLTSVSK